MGNNSLHLTVKQTRESVFGLARLLIFFSSQNKSMKMQIRACQTCCDIMTLKNYIFTKLSVALWNPLWFYFGNICIASSECKIRPTIIFLIMHKPYSKFHVYFECNRSIQSKQYTYIVQFANVWLDVHDFIYIIHSFYPYFGTVDPSQILWNDLKSQLISNFGYFSWIFIWNLYFFRSNTFSKWKAISEIDSKLFFVWTEVELRGKGIMKICKQNLF